MDKIILTEKEPAPDEDVLKSTLKDSYAYYADFRQKLRMIKPKITTEWRYYGKKNGWLLKHLDKTKNIVFLVPHDGFFKLTFTFGDKALAKISAADMIDPALKKQIDASVKYSEGTSVMLKVDSSEQVRQAVELIKYKLL